MGRKEVVTAPPVQPPPPTPSTPNPGTETHAWNELTNKRYMGIITDVFVDRVCYDHNPAHCTRVVRTDANGRAVLKANGQSVIDNRISLLPMRKWIGYSAYSAALPQDPGAPVRLWVANNGTLAKFASRNRGGKAWLGPLVGLRVDRRRAVYPPALDLRRQPRDRPLSVWCRISGPDLPWA